jgi:RHS repeat-associated protein
LRSNAPERGCGPCKESRRAPSELAPPAQEDYTGHVKDEATGLHYAGARYYSGAFGRWNAVDLLFPKFPSTSPYSYVLNNPLRYTDPTGLTPNDASKQLSEEPDDASGGPDDGCPDCAFEVQIEEVVVTAEREGQDGPNMPNT